MGECILINIYKTVEEIDKRYTNNLNLELKLSYLVTDILFPVKKREFKIIEMNKYYAVH